MTAKTVPSDYAHLPACPIRSCGAKTGKPCGGDWPDCVHKARVKLWSRTLQETPAMRVRRKKAPSRGAAPVRLADVIAIDPLWRGPMPACSVCQAAAGDVCQGVRGSGSMVHRARYLAYILTAAEKRFLKKKPRQAGAHEWTRGNYWLMPTCPVKSCGAKVGERCASPHGLVNYDAVHKARLVLHLEQGKAKQLHDLIHTPVKLTPSSRGVGKLAGEKARVDSLSGPGHISRAKERELDRDVTEPETESEHSACPMCGNHSVEVLYNPGHVTSVGGFVSVGCTKVMTCGAAVLVQLSDRYGMGPPKTVERHRTEAIQLAWQRWDRRVLG